MQWRGHNYLFLTERKQKTQYESNKDHDDRKTEVDSRRYHSGNKLLQARYLKDSIDDMNVSEWRAHRPSMEPFPRKYFSSDSGILTSISPTRVVDDTIAHELSDTQISTGLL